LGFFFSKKWHERKGEKGEGKRTLEGMLGARLEGDESNGEIQRREMGDYD
jgi:hypothetical protein